MHLNTAGKVSKYGVISGSNTGKYGPEITLYRDTFHAVQLLKVPSCHYYNLLCFLSYNNNALNVSLLIIPLKRSSPFMRYYVYRVLVWKMVRKFSILTLKLLTMLKRWLCFKERWQISRVKNAITIRIKNVQFFMLL